MNLIKNGVQKVVVNLYQKNGLVTSESLVAAAKPKKSPAHSGFEWNDTKAGHEYRLMQARQWIRRVVIIIEDKEDRFVHVPIIDNMEGYYKPISTVVKSSDEYRRALHQLNIKFNAAKFAFDELFSSFENKKVAKKIGKGLNIAKQGLDSLSP